MSTKHTREVLGTELPQISHAEVARLIRQAELMRAEYIAGLLRAAGRGVAHSARAALAALRVQRPRERAS
jgi:hypothetical protein